MSTQPSIEPQITSNSGTSHSSSSSHPLLQEAAREFFERRERAFRPTIVILAARALQALKRSPPAVFKLQCQLAEIVEMMSTAQVREAPRAP